MASNPSLETALALFRPRTLYAMRDSGLLQPLARGLYRLADLPPLSNPDLVIVARKLPQAVICLVSALAFHELTTQVPHRVDVALPNRAERPVLAYPPLQVFWFSGLAWSEGIEIHHLDNTPVRIYGPAKSVADIWKYRRKLGQDVALEALKLYRQRCDFDVNQLLAYARLCRVEKVLRPYLEALL